VISNTAGAHTLTLRFSGAGPKTLPIKKLTAERLAAAITAFSLYF
jgi:hypothetical protein